jgi:hypothetical protein
MPVNLMLLDRLGQPLPLLFVLAPRFQGIHVLGVINGERWRVSQLDLAVIIAHDDIVLREGGLGPGMELALVSMEVLLRHIVVEVQLLLIGRGRGGGWSARQLALEEVATNAVPCRRRHPDSPLGDAGREDPRGWSVSVGHRRQ